MFCIQLWLNTHKKSTKKSTTSLERDFFFNHVQALERKECFLQNFTTFYRILQNFTEFHRLLFTWYEVLVHSQNKTKKGEQKLVEHKNITDLVLVFFRCSLLQKFWKVSALVHVLSKVTRERTFGECVWQKF
jgi:hypothetical protein